MVIEHVTEDTAVAALQQHAGEVIKLGLRTYHPHGMIHSRGVAATMSCYDRHSEPNVAGDAAAPHGR